jgi:hypothetical protein
MQHLSTWKRILTVTLAAALMIGALSGCGGAKKDAGAKAAPVAAGAKVKINFPTAFGFRRFVRRRRPPLPITGTRPSRR